MSDVDTVAAEPEPEPKPTAAAPATGTASARSTDSTPADAARIRPLVPGIVGLVAFVVRLPGLGRPSALVFDEVFYAPGAADLLRWGSEHGQPAHPPLGKWFIAVGIRIFGFTPFGWRIAAVVAGAVVCATVAATVARLTGRAWVALTAGVLVTADGLVHVMSRLAMLDIFLTVFVVGTVHLLIRAWSAQPDRRAARRSLALAIVSLALGAAVKWSAAAMLPVVVGVGWTLERRLTPPGRPRRRAIGALVLVAVVAPLVGVVLASLPRELGPDPVTPAGWIHEQARVADFHRRLRPDNFNVAPATTWATLGSPSRLFAKTCTPAVAHSSDGTCTSGSPRTEVLILAVANPVVWYAGLLGLILGLVRAARGDPIAVILVGAIASQWLPWLLSPRNSYSFYAVTLVPLLVIAAAREVGLWRSARLAAATTGLVTLAAVVVFVLLWPIWSAQPIAPGHARSLLVWPGWR